MPGLIQTGDYQPGQVTSLSYASFETAILFIVIGGNDMKGYVANIENDTLENKDFRRVLYTAKNTQLVLMSLRPKEEIGLETHTLDQFIRVEAGQGVAILDGVTHRLSDGSAVVIPAGTEHNVINDSNTEDMKLYTLYSPPEHRDGTVHRTKNDALSHEEHFDGKTSE
jgi:mannose-6-phosphate isomerase-like protein (cupin superfamily)